MGRTLVMSGPAIPGFEWRRFAKVPGGKTRSGNPQPLEYSFHWASQEPQLKVYVAREGWWPK